MEPPIIVLGMHRSGTSALAGVLRMLGVNLGGHRVIRSPENPGGFWEHPDVVTLHEKLLAALNSSWHDVSPLPEKWIESASAKFVASELTAVIKRDFARFRTLGVQGSAHVQSAAALASVAGKNGSGTPFILLIRNPLEIAGALAKRDGFSQPKSLLLTLQHLVPAENLTRGCLRSIVDYHELVFNAVPTLEKIARDLGIVWPLQPEAVKSEIAGFFDPGLRHHRPDSGESAMPSLLRPPALECYRTLRSGKVRAAEEFAEAMRRLEAPLALGAQLADFETRLATTDEALKQSQARLAELTRTAAGLAQAQETLCEAEARRTALENSIRLHQENTRRLQCEVADRADREAEMKAKAARTLGKLEDVRRKLDAGKARIKQLETSGTRRLRPLLRVFNRLTWPLQHPRKFFSAILRKIAGESGNLPDHERRENGLNEMTGRICAAMPRTNGPITHLYTVTWNEAHMLGFFSGIMIRG